jgi:hypothetical protein
MTETTAAQHVFRFELWPPEAFEGTRYRELPLLLPDHSPRITAANPAEAAEKVKEFTPPGWTASLTQHYRYDCSPPHGGQNATYGQAS